MTKIANTEREEATCCKECNMWVKPNEFHPFAACLMFKHCRNSDMVRANLAFVQNKGFEEGQARAEQDFGMTNNTKVNLKDMLAKCKKLGIHYYGNGKTLSGDECLALINEFTTPQPAQASKVEPEVKNLNFNNGPLLKYGYRIDASWTYRARTFGLD